MGFSTTIFIALNTIEFCNKWIFPADSPREQPLVTIPDFILYWGASQLIITIYILLLVPEKVKYSPDEMDSDDEEEEEVTIKPS